MLNFPHRRRLPLLFLLPLAFGAVLALRLYYLQVVRKPHYQEAAEQQHNVSSTIIPSRGKIFDANGRELAGSTLLNSAYIETGRVPTGNPELVKRLAQALSEVTHAPFDEVLARLTGKVTRRPLLARELNDEQIIQLRGALAEFEGQVPLNLLTYEQEGKRHYSRGQVASQIVGYTVRNETGDNRGLAGIELAYNNLLDGDLATYRTKANAQQTPLEPIDPKILQSTFGKSVVLTIDEHIQEHAEKVLARHVAFRNAESGCAVVYNCKTGAVLAMANCPTFSLADVKSAREEQKRNRCITDSIEPGSVTKIFTFCSLFDEGVATPNDVINCEGGRWRTSLGRTIVDSHRMGSAPISAVFKESSNIGTVKAATRLGQSTFYRHMRAYGFGEKTDIDLPGEVPGRLKNVSSWSALSMSSLPMGYEFTATALQMAVAAGAVCNRGLYMQPHIVKEVRDYDGSLIEQVQPKVLRRVCNANASRLMLEMMELCVTDGTGKKAAVPGWRVGGKTGTTKKLDPVTKVYASSKYISSFCGVMPMSNPEIIIYVYVDNPGGTDYYGGAVAAPLFQEIAAYTANQLRLPRDAEGAGPSGQNEVLPATELALAEVRSELERRVPTAYMAADLGKHDAPASSGTMPRLRGLTMAEAREQLSALGINFIFKGSGVVAEQTPRAFETLEPDTFATLTFVHAQELTRRQVAEAAQLAMADRPDASDAGPAQAAGSGGGGGAAIEAAGSGIGAAALASNDAATSDVHLVMEAAGSRSRAGERVALPLVAAPELKPRRSTGPLGPGIGSPIATPAPVTDADPYARQKADPSEAQNAWADFAREKEAREREKAAAAAEAAVTAAGGAGSANSNHSSHPGSSGAATGPKPESDTAKPTRSPRRKPTTSVYDLN